MTLDKCENMKSGEIVETGAADGGQRVQNTMHAALPQVLAVSIKNVLLLGYGMTLGFPTIVIPALDGDDAQESLVLTFEQISWISSINLICVPLGCLFSGIITQPLGRKRSMQLLNIPFLGAWLLFHYASTVDHLYMALCLTGLSGGLLEAPVITYVAEITQPHLRGMLSATSSMTIIFGVMTQFLLGTFLNWRTVALLNVIIPLLAVVLLFIVPESPHWLILKDRFTDAQQSLAWLRGWTTVDQVDSEYKQLCEALGKTPPVHNGLDNPAFDGQHCTSNDNGVEQKCTSTRSSDGGYLEILKRFTMRSFILPSCIVCFSFFLGHFSGMTTLQTYAVQIFQTLHTPIDKYYATLLLGIVELLGTLVCVVGVHYVGKRPLTFFSTLGCGVCFLVVATYAYLIDVQYLAMSHKLNITSQSTFVNNTSLASHTTDTQSLQWLPTVFLIGSAFISHCGIRLLPWVLIGEVYPGNIRAMASGISGGVGYIFGFAANKAFLSMIRTLTLPGTFWMYGSLSLVGTVVLYLYLPETEGRTLRDIELHFSGVKKIPRNAGVYKHTDAGVVNEGYTEKPTNNEHTESRF
ncbi:uncharacterized protein CBL_06856 [Carabus blaptoides fortunei]